MRMLPQFDKGDLVIGANVFNKVVRATRKWDCISLFEFGLDISHGKETSNMAKL
jgi:hypothetical protein